MMDEDELCQIIAEKDDEIAALEARLEALNDALEPFAKAADNFDRMPIKDAENWFAYISVGSLRRARAALRNMAPVREPVRTAEALE